MNVSAADICFWGLDSPTSNQTIALFNILDRQPSMDILKQKIDSALTTFPKLSMRRANKPSSGWIPIDTIDLNYHLQTVVIQDPKEDFLSAASREFSKALCLEKPLWRLVVIKDPKTQRSALLYMIHHSLADGMSGLALFYSLCDKQKSTTQDLNLDALRPFRTSKKIESAKTVSAFQKILSDAFSKPNPENLHGTSSSKREFVCLKIPLANLREAKANHKLSLNEIFLLIVNSGLVEFQKQAQRSLKKFSALIPINLRENQDIIDLGNHLSAVRITLPSHLTPLPLQIKGLRDELSKIQQKGWATAYKILSNLLAKLPFYIRTKVLNSAAKRIDCICTNVPGPKQQHWIAGAAIEDTWGVPALMNGQGIGFAAVRYQRDLYISAVYDPKIVKDSTHILEGITSCIQELSAGNDETQSYHLLAKAVRS